MAAWTAEAEAHICHHWSGIPAHWRGSSWPESQPPPRAGDGYQLREEAVHLGRRLEHDAGGAREHGLLGDAACQGGGHATCTSGGGRLLDYFIISEKLEPIINPVGLDLKSPWKLHSAVSLLLSTRPRQVQVLKHMVPKQIPKPVEDLMPLSWEHCMQQARDFLERGMVRFPAPEVVEMHLARNPRAAEAIELGSRMSHWALAMELHGCSRAGVLGAKALLYLGRGQHPNIIKVPLLERVDSSKHWGPSESVWWAALSARLRDLNGLLLSDRSEPG